MAISTLNEKEQQEKEQRKNHKEHLLMMAKAHRGAKMENSGNKLNPSLKSDTESCMWIP